MSKLQPVRGTCDLLFEDYARHQHVIDTAKATGRKYGFEGIATPIFESTEVFKRTLGETSDVVNKEMYSFESRGGESLTLRPEFTAGIARAFISNGLQQNLPLKLFSTGPLFRYERPQKGRQRQFHQINFEYLGEENYSADYLMIAMANDILQELGIQEYALEINSLGNKESRARYVEALKNYLSASIDDLSEDSRVRLEKNPLRILDSKDRGDQALLKGAPSIIDYLDEESKTVLDNVSACLNAEGIPFSINPAIVRGLDYYNDVVFEFVSTSEQSGAKSTILAGGRYDNLIKNMGGTQTAAVGFAAGIERLLLLTEAVAVEAEKIFILPDGDDAIPAALSVMKKIQAQSAYGVEFIPTGNLGKKIKKANKLHAIVMVIVHNDNIEIKANTPEGEELVQKLKGWI